MKIILVRHVETYGNVERRLHGHTDSPYTPRGERMKIQLIDELVDMHQKSPITHVYTSPTLRAFKIAEAFSSTVGLQVQTQKVLREYHFGIFDGLSEAEARQIDEPLWESWMHDPNNVTLPEGDNYMEYHKRQAGFLKELHRNHAGQKARILIVSHAGAIHSLLTNLLDIELDKKWHFDVALGSIAEVDTIDGYGILRRLYLPDYTEE